MARYDEVKTFIETNKRNPSKYAPEERNMYNYIKHTRRVTGGQVPRHVRFRVHGSGFMVNGERFEDRMIWKK